MPSWLIKTAIQGTLSRLPNPQRWNSVFQRRVTGSTARVKPEGLLKKWAQAQRHLAHYKAHSGASDRPRVLELGTGWHPIVPIALVLGGAHSVQSLDKVGLISEEGLQQVLGCLRAELDGGRLTIDDPEGRTLAEDVLPRADSMSLDAILDALHLSARVMDARDTDLPAASVDLFVSNNTFEHIPRSVLEQILVEYRRLAAPGAVGSHFIDLADHYAGFDSSINVYNFLRFSERRWRVFNNELQYQNRLRVRDYREVHASAGWNVVEERNESDVAALATVPVHAAFAAYDREDLAVYHSWMVSLPT